MQVLGLYAGKAKLLVSRNKMSAIDKQPVQQARLEPLGLEGDEQADLVNHGGPRQALHQYSEASYEALKAAFPDLAERFTLGSIGENISISQMNDDNVFLNDVYQIGDEVQVRVTRPRRPCWKVDEHYGAEGITKFIFQRPITGWYYEVITPGLICVGDSVKLITRDSAALSVAQAWLTKQFEK